MRTMSGQLWQVNVAYGSPKPMDLTAPIMMGTPTILVGGDEPSDPFVPILYGPVYLRHVDGWMAIETREWVTHDNVIGHPPGSAFEQNKIYREMHHARLELDHSGELRISGLEERADGAMVRALWIAEPYESNEPENLCEHCSHFVEWHTRHNGDDQFAQDGKGACISVDCDCPTFVAEP